MIKNKIKGWQSFNNCFLKIVCENQQETSIDEDEEEGPTDMKLSKKGRPFRTIKKSMPKLERIVDCLHYRVS